jgi:hypothetical protein
MAVIVVGALLVFAIYFTELGMQWVTFLTGVLIAAVLGMTSRASQAGWVNTRRTAQLTLAKDKLGQETLLRKKATEDHQQALLQLQQTERAFGRLIPHQLHLWEKTAFSTLNSVTSSNSSYQSCVRIYVTSPFCPRT